MIIDHTHADENVASTPMKGAAENIFAAKVTPTNSGSSQLQLSAHSNVHALSAPHFNQK